jgi:uncharacterized paraquat-inducible protein A
MPVSTTFFKLLKIVWYVKFNLLPTAIAIGFGKNSDNTLVSTIETIKDHGIAFTINHDEHYELR